MKILSRYADFENAKLSKKILIRILDFLIVFIVSTIIYGIPVKLIGNATKYTNTESAQDAWYEAVDYICETHIFEKENGDTMSQTSLQARNIRQLTKYSLSFYKNESDEIENYEQIISSKKYSETNTLTEETASESDNYCYYFTNFKLNNNSLYSGDNQVNSESNYLNYYLNIVDYQNNDYYVENLISNNEYSYFNLESTSKLANYLFLEETLYYDFYSNVLSLYDDIYLKAYEDLKDNSEFILISNNYDKEMENYLRHIVDEMIISYFIATILCYFLPYFIFKKDYISFSSRILKCPTISRSGEKVKFYQSLIYYVSSFILNIPSITLIVLFLYSSSIYLLFVDLILNLNILIITGCSLILWVGSIICCSIDKKRELVSNILSRTETKELKNKIVKEEVVKDGTANEN